MSPPSESRREHGSRNLIALEQPRTDATHTLTQASSRGAGWEALLNDLLRAQNSEREAERADRGMATELSACRVHVARGDYLHQNRAGPRKRESPGGFAS